MIEINRCPLCNSLLVGGLCDNCDYDQEIEFSYIPGVDEQFEMNSCLSDFGCSGCSVYQYLKISDN